METNRDEELWQLAKKRASFQRSLVSYFVINAFFWLIWWFTTDNKPSVAIHHGRHGQC